MSRISRERMQKAVAQLKAISKEDHAKVKGLAIVSRRAQRWDRRLSLWMMFLIPVAVVVTSCSKQADSGGTETALPVQASDNASNPEPPAAAIPATEVATPETPKVSAMMITYQTQSTPSQNMFPPEVRLAPTVGEEIRYLDLANNRMRVEKYAFGNSGKRLHQNDDHRPDGLLSFRTGEERGFFIPMKTPVPVWNFDQNINTKWAREHGLPVKPLLSCPSAQWRIHAR